MRKILLASTALVALTSVSAMAADVTISGSMNFIYSNDEQNEFAGDGATFGSASQFESETDLNVSFTNTTDNGITTTLNVGIDESNVDDDATATISGLIPGTIRLVSAGMDDNYVVSMDEKFNKAGEGTAGEDFNLGGATGESIGYQFPTIVDGLTLAVQHSNEDIGESTGYGASFDAGIATLTYAAINTNTQEFDSVSVSGAIAGISFGIEQNKIENGASKDEANLWGVSYTMDAITLAYEAGTADNEDGDVEDYTQVAVSYAVAPGINFIVTSSEVEDIDGANAADVEELEMQLKLSF